MLTADDMRRLWLQLMHVMYEAAARGNARAKRYLARQEPRYFAEYLRERPRIVAELEARKST